MASGRVDADACREHLGTLLSEETQALRELEDLLQREYEVLCAKNVAAIERAALVRQEKMGELARTEEQRRQLCTLHGHSPDWIGLENLMQWCDSEGSLLPRLRECASRAIRCRDLNDKNGTLVAAVRLRQVEGMLAALTPGHAQPVTYGPKGSTAKVNRSHEWGRV